MSVKIEDGTRSVQVEVEVPGTPEQVWQAIATGPGVSSWFVPTQIEEREGGKVVSSFGEGMDETATIQEWQPPHRFVAVGKEWPPGAPPMATEWAVEARDGGHCVVRVVHSLFASSDEWDAQLEGTESGWPFFFRILRLVLTHYQGQAVAPLQMMGVIQADKEGQAEIWQAMTRALGLDGAAEGTSFQAPASVPTLVGEVDLVQTDEHRQLLARVDQPAPGFATVSVCGPYISFGLYFFGDGAAAAIERDATAWRKWFDQYVPAESAAESTDASTS